MNRREALKLLGTGILPFLFPNTLKALGKFLNNSIKASDFGKFNWGISSAAFQIEGGWNIDDKGPSIWDVFNHKKGNIKDGSNADVSCDFYHNYSNDIDLVKQMEFKANRFSISWPRLLPAGIGTPNQKGIDFYNRVIDTCLKNEIDPWVTLYHWDLPQALEDSGGWTNRDIVGWFSDYTELCARSFGDRVKKWVVLNEPMGFVGLGYGLGIHAPGLTGLKYFLPATHHAILCQAIGGSILRDEIQGSYIGTTFSCSPVIPYHHNTFDNKAAHRMDALLNRLYIEPSLGLGYPVNELHFLKKIEKYIFQGDERKMVFDFDFIGLQNYFRVFVDFSLLIPLLWAKQVSPNKNNSQLTEMGWEIYPDALYQSIMQFSKYPIKDIIITENGASFKDVLDNGHIHDELRIKYFQDYLSAILKAKNDGANVTGYFAWTLLDNFEWLEGYRPKFGLIYVDFETQKRVLKDSGKWFCEFLKQ